MSSHALFPPSASVRWINCPGSVALTCNLPGQTSTFADEGTAAHHLANRALTYNERAEFFLGETIRVNDHTWEFTQAMCDAVQVYLDYISASAKELGATVLAEQRVSLERTLGLAEQGGTSDAVLLALHQDLVKITDLKFGRGEKVDAFYPCPPDAPGALPRAGGYFQMNSQLGLYALGVLETITDLFGPISRIQLSIVQPRIDNISEFEVSLAELQALGAQAREAVQLGTQAMLGDPAQYLHASEKACRWCPIKADCPALRDLVASQIADEFDAPVVTKVRAGTLGTRYEQLELIEQYCAATREAMLNAVASGNAPIGPDGRPYKLVQGRGGHRAWKNATAAGDVLAGLLGPAAYEPPTVITPAVADKAINKGRKVKTAMWTDFVAPLVHQPAGKPVIAQGSDERPEYTSATQEDFNVQT